MQQCPLVQGGPSAACLTANRAGIATSTELAIVLAQTSFQLVSGCNVMFVGRNRKLVRGRRAGTCDDLRGSARFSKSFSPFMTQPHVHLPKAGTNVCLTRRNRRPPHIAPISDLIGSLAERLSHLGGAGLGKATCVVSLPEQAGASVEGGQIGRQARAFVPGCVYDRTLSCQPQLRDLGSFCEVPLEFSGRLQVPYRRPGEPLGSVPTHP